MIYILIFSLCLYEMLLHRSRFLIEIPLNRTIALDFCQWSNYFEFPHFSLLAKSLMNLQEKYPNNH
jgi:hypothetical protein